MTTTGVAASGESGTLIQGTTDQPVSYDPAGSYDLPSYNVIFNVYQNLLQVPPGGNTARARGRRVVRLHRQDHARSTSARSRRGSRSPTAPTLTSEDVKASLRAQPGDRRSRRAPPRSTSTSRASRRPTTQTVVFNLKAPDATWPFLLTSGGAAIVPGRVPGRQDPAVRPGDRLRPLHGGRVRARPADRARGQPRVHGRRPGAGRPRDHPVLRQVVDAEAARSSRARSTSPTAR